MNTYVTFLNSIRELENSQPKIFKCAHTHNDKENSTTGLKPCQPMRKSTTTGCPMSSGNNNNNNNCCQRVTTERRNGRANENRACSENMTADQNRRDVNRADFLNTSCRCKNDGNRSCNVLTRNAKRAEPDDGVAEDCQRDDQRAQQTECKDNGKILQRHRHSTVAPNPGQRDHCNCNATAERQSADPEDGQSLRLLHRGFIINYDERSYQTLKYWWKPKRGNCDRITETRSGNDSRPFAIGAVATDLYCGGGGVCRIFNTNFWRRVSLQTDEFCNSFNYQIRGVFLFI